MCGRYTWTAGNIGKFKELVKEPEHYEEPNYNRAPGQYHPSISSHSGNFQWQNMLWGNPKSGSSVNGFFPINARSETVLQKPIFRKSFLENRCLIPADGWFEWQIIESQKYPHHIYSENGEDFAFAGIWKCIDQKITFSVLTCSAAPNILHIHHRAPVALTEDYWELWLDVKQSQDSLRTLAEASQPIWKAQQVSSRVNSTRNNDPEILNPNSGKQSLLF